MVVVFTSVISPTPRLVRVVDQPDRSVKFHSLAAFDAQAAAAATTTGIGGALPGTRVLSVEEFGDPDGRPIFFHHTEVGSRVLGCISFHPLRSMV